MKHAILIAAVLLVVGCSGSTSVNSRLDVSSIATSHYVAGGLTFTTNDTLVDFDLSPNVRVTNPTNEPLPLLFEYHFSVGSDAYSSRSLNFGELPAGASRSLDSAVVVTIPRRFAGQNILCEILFRDGNPDGSSTLGSYSESRSDIPFAARYHGLFYTTEASPDPIATLDQPLDWLLTEGPVHLDGIYPNPTHGSATVSLALNAPIDSAKGLLRITPNSHADTVFSLGASSEGQYMMQNDLSGKAPGLYRLDFLVWESGNKHLVHANICVSKL